MEGASHANGGATSDVRASMSVMCPIAVDVASRSRAPSGTTRTIPTRGTTGTSPPSVSSPAKSTPEAGKTRSSGCALLPRLASSTNGTVVPWRAPAARIASGSAGTSLTDSAARSSGSGTSRRTLWPGGNGLLEVYINVLLCCQILEIMYFALELIDLSHNLGDWLDVGGVDCGGRIHEFNWRHAGAPGCDGQ